MTRDLFAAAAVLAALLAANDTLNREAACYRACTTDAECAKCDGGNGDPAPATLPGDATADDCGE